MAQEIEQFTVLFYGVIGDNQKTPIRTIMYTCLSWIEEAPVRPVKLRISVR